MIKKLRISIRIHIDTDRNVGDLLNPDNYLLAFIDHRHDEVIYDTDLNLPGEVSYKPKIQVIE